MKENKKRKKKKKKARNQPTTNLFNLLRIREFNSIAFTPESQFVKKRGGRQLKSFETVAMTYNRRVYSDKSVRCPR